jgi:hypothetical protein
MSWERWFLNKKPPLTKGGELEINPHGNTLNSRNKKCAL